MASKLFAPKNNWIQLWQQKVPNEDNTMPLLIMTLNPGCGMTKKRMWPPSILISSSTTARSELICRPMAFSRPDLQQGKSWFPSSNHSNISFWKLHVWIFSAMLECLKVKHVKISNHSFFKSWYHTFNHSSMLFDVFACALNLLLKVESALVDKCSF